MLRRAVRVTVARFGAQRKNLSSQVDVAPSWAVGRRPSLEMTGRPPDFVEPDITNEEYVSRRHAVLSQMPSHSLAIFPSSPTLYMSEDVPHLFHQNTDLSYLTGCAEPGSVLVLDNTVPEDVSAGPAGRSLLFVEARSEERERWDGPMHGVSEDTRQLFGVDEVLATSSLPSMLADRMTCKVGASREHACQQVFLDPTINSEVTSAVGDLRSDEARSRFLMSWARDTRPKHFVCTSRLIKSKAEIELLRLSCSAMAGALNDAMAHCILEGKGGKGGNGQVRERVIEAYLEFGAKMRGATRMAFPSVVASGRNGTVLHYMENGMAADDGDFVMVDAGCILGGACSDISRSWPVNGTFTGPQRDIYELLLDVQRQCIDFSQEGAFVHGRPVSMNGMHRFACRSLTEGLQSLGFMKGMSAEQAVAQGAYQVRSSPTDAV